MCLGVPGRVVSWLRREPPFAEASVQFDGVRRTCNMSCVPDAEAGDYVIVHAGVAICVIDAEEAARSRELLGLPGLTESHESHESHDAQPTFTPLAGEPSDALGDESDEVS